MCMLRPPAARSSAFDPLHLAAVTRADGALSPPLPPTTSAAAAAPPPPRDKKVKLSFRLPYRTEFGQDVAIVGSHGARPGAPAA